jgi:hypothetical protein
MATALSGLSLAKDVARELGMLMPRTVAGLRESTGWAPLSPRGVRQFGEAMLDELVLSGFSLLGGSPAPMRPLDGCTAAAEELSSLGIDRAHADPKPLRPASIHKRSIAGLAYERMVFEHDPALPATLEADGLGGPARAVVHLCRHPGTPAGPGHGWCGCTVPVRAARKTCCCPGLDASITRWGSTSRCRYSPATAVGDANGRPIPTWIRWAMWRA